MENVVNRCIVGVFVKLATTEYVVFQCIITVDKAGNGGKPLFGALSPLFDANVNNNMIVGFNLFC